VLFSHRADLVSDLPRDPFPDVRGGYLIFLGVGIEITMLFPIVEES
jgi:hypothetical protein